MVEEQDCEQCGHPTGPHAMVATGKNPLHGGIMLCPEDGCECYSTWDVPPHSSRTDIVIPSKSEIAILRQGVQHPF